MRHVIRLQDIAIGYSDLEDADAALGRARGKFRPAMAYDLVQPVFRLYSEAIPDPGGPVADEEKLARYQLSRDKLGLKLEDDTGRIVRTSAIHIIDYASRKGEIDVEILITDREYWRQRAEKPG